MTPDTAPPAEPSPPTEPTSPAPKGGARRVVLAVLPAVLVLGALGGAAAYTEATVNSADRTVTTKVWGGGAHKPAKDPAGDVGRGRADTELSKLLLPVPENYRLGPDMGEYGNDDEISGKKATAQMKESGRGIAGKQRRERDQRIDRLHVQGIAQRSYTSDDNDLTVEIQIVKMKDKRAVHDMFGFQTELMGTYGGFRKGPTIEGHKKAKCFREPQTKSKLDALFCFAYDGELSLTVNAYGTKPFSASHVADLVKDQLDHIESPGEYV